MAALVRADGADVPEGGGRTHCRAASTKAFGRLAVISQWRTEPRLLFTLPPEAFTPPPKISSAVVGFAPRHVPMPACDVITLGRVTAAAFGQRRKMLRQSLKALRARAGGAARRGGARWDKARRDVDGVGFRPAGSDPRQAGRVIWQDVGRQSGHCRLIPSRESSGSCR